MRRTVPRLVTDGPSSEPQAERRHRTLTELKRTVRHHPAVDVAAGVESAEGRFREVEVTFDPVVLGVDTEWATMRIEWRPRQDPRDQPFFVFHYADSTGRDFGWHREPNPHGDRLEHFQERMSAADEYEYEPAYFESQSPVALLWEILGRIEERVGIEEGN